MGILFLLSGCTFSQVDKQYTLKEKDTIYVIGINSQDEIPSERFEFVLWSADNHGDAYTIENAWKRASYADAPKDGYIVGHTSNEDYIGFQSLYLYSENKKHLVFQQRFCRGIKAPVFKVPLGKVVYVGDLNLKFEEGIMKYSLTSDIEKANQFVNQNYPNLKNKLESTEVELLYPTQSCTREASFVPIFIPM